MGSDPAGPRLRAGETYAPPVASAFADDFYDKKQEERRGRSLPLVGIIVVTLAILVGIALLWPGRQCGFPGRPCDRNTMTAKTEQANSGTNADTESRVPSESQNSAATADIGAPSPPSAPPAATAPPSATAPPVATAPSEASPSARAQLPPRTLPSLREGQSSERAGARTARSEAPRPSPDRGTSEERMATFLLRSLDSGDAEARARENSTWYEPGQIERTYWERVADVIRRRRGQ
jgi:cytoskeletal protein RodZ